MFFYSIFIFYSFVHLPLGCHTFMWYFCELYYNVLACGWVLIFFCALTFFVSSFFFFYILRSALYFILILNIRFFVDHSLLLDFFQCICVKIVGLEICFFFVPPIYSSFCVVRVVELEGLWQKQTEMDKYKQRTNKSVKKRGFSGKKGRIKLYFLHFFWTKSLYQK